MKTVSGPGFENSNLWIKLLNQIRYVKSSIGTHILLLLSGQLLFICYQPGRWRAQSRSSESSKAWSNRAGRRRAGLDPDNIMSTCMVQLPGPGLRTRGPGPGRSIMIPVTVGKGTQVPPAGPPAEARAPAILAGPGPGAWHRRAHIQWVEYCMCQGYLLSNVPDKPSQTVVLKFKNTSI